MMGFFGDVMKWNEPLFGITLLFRKWLCKFPSIFDTLQKLLSNVLKINFVQKGKIIDKEFKYLNVKI